MKARVVVGIVLATLLTPVRPAAAAPNDPLFALQWGPQQVGADRAWERSTGEGVVLAVIDTGIDQDHPDLFQNTIPGISFVACGDLGCGSGDWESPASVEPSGHGTHVAGIAAAVADNGRGIAGVAPDAQLLAIRVVNGTSATRPDFVAGVRWAVDHGADVINVSLADRPGTQIETAAGRDADVTTALRYANDHGVIVVAGAGNNAASVCGVPAWNDGLLCVAATMRTEGSSAYSNFGVKPDRLAVAAPGGLYDPNIALVSPELCGEGILSTVPVGQGSGTLSQACGWPSDPAGPDHVSYEEGAGTSQATPHVAGAAALLVGMGCTRQETIDLLISTARRPGTDTRGVWDPRYGYGIVDIDEATRRAQNVCTTEPDANRPPVLADDLATVHPGGSVELDVLGNDQDPEGTQLSLASVGSPSHGFALAAEGGTISYTPHAGFVGLDRFRYAVTDDAGDIAAGTVTVSVEAQDTAPVARDDMAIAVAGESIAIDVLANDHDPGAGEPSLIAVGAPERGTAQIEGALVRYEAPPVFDGTDSFSYTVADPSGQTALGTVTVLAPSCLATFVDDLEPTPEPGWSTDHEGGTAQTVHWRSVVDPMASSPTTSFFSDAATQPKDDRLVAPAQSISPQTVLRFNHRFDFEDDYDGGVLEVSTDGGQTWAYIATDRFLAGGYNGYIDPGYQSPHAGRPAWTGDAATAMAEVVVDLSDFAGHTTLVRWRLATDAFTGPYDVGLGWWLDDVRFERVVTGSCADQLS